MQNSDNIEKIFQETFEHFEADVNPKVWTNVQHGIHSGAGGTATAAAKFAVGKIIAGIASVAAIAGSIWYFSQPVNKKEISATENKPKTESVSNTSAEVQNNISENRSSGAFSNTATNKHNPPAAGSVNSNKADNSKEAKNISGSYTIPALADVPSSDNAAGTASSQPAPKYGPAPKGDGGMMRGTQVQGPRSTSSKDNSSSPDEQAAETAAPTAIIFATTTSGDAPLTVTFISQTDAASSLNWDFADGSVSADNSPSHTFDKAGKYEVTLLAKNSAGTTPARVTIEVRSVSDILNVPNVFTPNGDGRNDFFSFEMKNIATIGVAIYSQKTGELISRWNTLDGKWDGKRMNGEDAPAGVYFYAIQANGTDGVLHSKNGIITLEK